MKRIFVFALAICMFSLAADSILKPGEEIRVDLPSGRGSPGKRLIAEFTARYARPMRIGGDWYMQITLNGQKVASHLLPEGSGIIRLVNRTSPTFHGTRLSYTNKGLWSVVSNSSSEPIEGIYVPDDYPQLYKYAVDLTDMLSPDANTLVITNMAPGPGRNERNHTPYLLYLSTPEISVRSADSLPAPVERGFEPAMQLPDLDLPVSTPPKSVDLADFPQRPGWKRVIRLRARLNFGGGGSGHTLQVLVNGKMLTGENSDHQSRILNRSANFMNGTETLLGSNGRLNLMYGSSWGPQSRHGDSEEARRINWYYLDIDDMLNASGNRIALANAANTGYFNAKRGFTEGRPFVIVRNFEAGYLPDSCLALAPARQIPSRKIAENVPVSRHKAYTLGIAPQGGLQITFGKQNIFVESFYSYPKSGFNAFLCDAAPAEKSEPSWKGAITPEDSGFRYEFNGKYYHISRTIRCEDLAIHVKDRIENISGAPLGMKTGVRVISDTRADNIRKNGCQLYQNSLSSHGYPNANSSIYWSYRDCGAGLVLVDELLRLQCRYRADQYDGEVSTANLGFDTGKAHTLEWSIYLTPKGDYYDFVNAVRHDWKVNEKTIPGMISWNSYHINNLPDMFMKRYDNLGSSIIIDGQAWFNASKYHEKEFSVEKELTRHVLWKDAAVKLRPELCYLLQFQTVFSWRNKEGAPDMMGDSVLIDPEGKISVYARAQKGANPNSTYQSGEPGLYHAYHYPMIGNRYHQYMMEVAGKSLDAGFGGVYYDTPNYTAINYGRFTYDRWDGCTVDLNPDYTIERKYADVCLLSAEARYQLYKSITDRNGVVVLNGPPLIRKIQEMKEPVIHFSEGDREDRLAQMHFSTPLMLGQHGSNGKAAYGRRQYWKTEEDFMDDMVWKVQNGILYAAYWPPRYISERHEWPTRDMFPITVKDIHGGWIRGTERIITVKSGKFAWEDPVSSARLRSYGCDGRMVDDKRVSPGPDGKFDIQVPDHGMSILIR